MSHTRHTPSISEGNLPSMSDCGDREWPAVWLSIAVSLLIYVLMAVALARFIPGPDTPLIRAAVAKAAATEFVYHPELEQHIRPEPLEKARYLLGLLCIPTLPTVFYVLGRRFMRPEAFDFLNRPGPLAARDRLLAIILAVWLLVLLRFSQIPNSSGYLLVSLLMAIAIVFRWRDLPRMSAIMSWWVVGSLAVLGFLTQCVGDNWFFRCHHFWHHLDIVLAVVNQVAHGKTILVDTTSQYGLLYPYAIAAALAPFGVSMPGMTVVFALLILLQAAILFLAFSRLPGMSPAWRAAFAISYAGLVAPGLGMALFGAPSSLFYVDILQPDADFATVYLQFVPIRTIWFAVFVWLCSPGAFQTRRWFVPLGYVLAGVSLLWNTDTGLVILVAWTGMLIYSRLDDWWRNPGGLLRHTAIHLAALAGTLVGSLAFYAAFAWLRSGQLPRYNELLFFQRIFYQAGFYMRPMPLWEFWQPIIAVLALTIAWCMRQAVREQLPARAPWLFFIAAYGLGSFSYYQGRSLPQVLPSVFLPALLLAFFWTRQGMSALTGHTLADIRRDANLRLVAISTVPLAVFCLCGLVNLCRSLPAAVLYSFNTTGTVDARRMEPLIAALRPIVSGKEVVFLTDPEAFMHTKTGSWSALPMASVSEVFLRSQVADIQRSIEKPGTVFVFRPEPLPRWFQQLDLSSFTEKQQLPYGFTVLEYEPKAEQR
jgi:hypothetical protein